MSRIKVKPCPICKIGKLRVVHYAFPLKFYPDLWEETEDCLLEPVRTFKRVECSNCGATTYMNSDVEVAVKYWNEEENGVRHGVLQYIIDEELEVEENSEA